MLRFEELLAAYTLGCLDADGRAELADYVDSVPECLDAFVDVVSELRIRRLELARG